MKTDASQSPGSNGFSLIEVLIASAVLLIIALGIVPLFSRALQANFYGGEATRASQFGTSRIEELYQIEFNHAAMEPTDDAVVQHFSSLDHTWTSGPPPLGSTGWQRETSIEQFGVGDLYDDKLLNSPLPAGTEATAIHLKRVTVEMENVRDPNNPLRPRRPLILRSVRPF